MDPLIVLVLVIIMAVVGLLLWLLGAAASIPFVVLATYLAQAALTVLVSDPSGYYAPLQLADQGRRSDGSYLVGSVTVNS